MRLCVRQDPRKVHGHVCVYVLIRCCAMLHVFRVMSQRSSTAPPRIDDEFNRQLQLTVSGQAAGATSATSCIDATAGEIELPCIVVNNLVGAKQTNLPLPQQLCLSEPFESVVDTAQLAAVQHLCHIIW